jgi:excisionase family DNA binding protein
MELLECSKPTYYELLSKHRIAHWIVRGRRVTTEAEIVAYLERVGHDQYVPAVA